MDIIQENNSINECQERKKHHGGRLIKKSLHYYPTIVRDYCVAYVADEQEKTTVLLVRYPTKEVLPLLFHQLQIVAVAFKLHVFLGDEAQGGTVDAVAESSLVLGTVVEDVSQVGFTGLAPDFGTDHAMGKIRFLHDFGGVDGF